MAFVLGVYAFGAYGVLLGPLVSGALLALLEIYKAYLPKVNCFGLIRLEFWFVCVCVCLMIKEDNDDVDQERFDAPELDEQDETTKVFFKIHFVLMVQSILIII